MESLDSALTEIQDHLWQGNVAPARKILKRLSQKYHIQEALAGLVWDLAQSGSARPELDITLLEMISSFSTVPWFAMEYHGEHMLVALMGVRKYDLIEVAIKESISNPSAWWNPLTAHNWNLAAVAIAYHAPFSFLRRLLEAMQAIKINIDKSHRGLGRPLMLVAQENDLFMPDLTVMRDQEAICEMLLTFGACPLSKDRVNIPLHYVLREKKKKLAGFMIKSLKKQAAKPASEIDIDWKDATGSTPLLLAIDSNYPAQALDLMEIGADLFAANKKGACALSCLFRKKQKAFASLKKVVVSRLQPQDFVRGLRVELDEKHRDTINELLLTHSAAILEPLKGQKKQQEIVLQEVIDMGYVPAVEKVLECCKGVDISNCCIQSMVSAQNTAIVLKLIACGAGVNTFNPEAPDGRGYMIQSAVSAGNVELSTELLQMGADIAVKDSNGDCLLHMACRIGIAQVRRCMVELIARRAPWQISAKNNLGQGPVEQAMGRKGIAKMVKRILAESEREASDAATKDTREIFCEENIIPNDPECTVEHTGSGEQVLPTETVSEACLASSTVQNFGEHENVEAVEGEASFNEVSILEQWIPSDEMREQRDARIMTGISAAASFIRAADQRILISQEASLSNGTRSDQVFREAVQSATPGCSECDDSFEDLDTLSESDQEEFYEEEEEVMSDDLPSLMRLWEDVKWGIQITRDAWGSWAHMNRDDRSRCLPILHRLGNGQWSYGKNTQPLKHKPLQGRKLWKHRISKAGRVVFETCVDYNEDKGVWIDTIRIWVVTMVHREYEKALEGIKRSYQNSSGVLQKAKLTPVQRHRDHSNERMPMIYREVEENSTGPTGCQQCQEEILEVVPPTNAYGDTHNLLKFYTIGPSQIKCILDGLDDKNIDFPFKVSPPEREIINKCESDPSPVILVGRSGTGKTTCAVYRLLSNWLKARETPGNELNQVFVTASATLKDQVEKTFRKLQMAALPEEERENTKAITRSVNFNKPLLRRDYPTTAFPLFLTSLQYLQIVDGTLETPFYPRNADGSIRKDESDEAHFDVDGMDLLVMLDVLDDESDSDDSVLGIILEGEGEDESHSVEEEPHLSSKVSRQRVHMTYHMFETKIWPKIAHKGDCKGLEPSLVLLEILSYIKGSAEAIQSAKGYLNDGNYMQIGRKRAPAYANKRERVYKAFKYYQKELKDHWMFDTADLVGHIYRETVRSGYKGMPLHHIVRDEVQDFSQAELLLDMRIISSPNGLFYCGDTCQTISRGVGFRFTDIKTLFYEERKSRESTGTAFTVADPLLERLAVNYRTHSGILDVACSIVDLLERYFPQYMDKLPRESAFFKGGLPHILQHNKEEDVLDLVAASSSVGSSQVEFGGHQAVLVRGMDSYPRTKGPMWNGAAVLTIPQAKGLEFDDVFIMNFFNDSPACKEWRILMSYIAELEEEGGSSTNGALRDVEVAPEEKGYLRKIPFEPSQCILLCEELKHLYTATTRAKRNLVFFDRSIEKRAPFFHYLQRRGIAQVISDMANKGSMLAILSVPASKLSDWSNRGHHFMKNRLYEHALKSFENAKEPVWALVAYAGLLLQKTSTSQDHRRTQQKDMYCKAAYHLLIAASQATNAREKVKGKVVEKWLGACAGAFAKGERFSEAAELYEQLNDLKNAKKMYLAMRSYDKVAISCERLKQWRQAAVYHTHKLNKNRQDIRALDILQTLIGGKKTLADQEMQASLAKRIFIIAKSKGDRTGMRKACNYMIEKDIMPFLSEQEEWKLLAELHPNNVKGAEVWAQMGKFEKAAERLECSQKEHDLEEKELLLSYYLKAGTQDALSRLLALYTEHSWRHETRVKTVLQLIALAKKHNVDHDQLMKDLEDLLRTWPKEKENNWLDILEVLSRCVDCAGKDARYKLAEFMDVVDIPKVLGFAMKAFQNLQPDYRVYTNQSIVSQVQCYYGIHGLQKKKTIISYSTLNLRFAHVLSQIGIHSEAGSEANLNLNCTVHITNCKEAIIVDIYLLLRSILWNVLFFHERNVLEKTQKMTSRDTMHNTDNASVVRGIALDRVNHLFLGICAFNNIRTIVWKLSTLRKSLLKIWSKHAQRCLRTDIADVQYSTIMDRYQSILFTRWSGFTVNRCILMPRSWYADLKGIAGREWTVLNTAWKQCININRFLDYSSRFSSVQHVVDPNISFWLLRAAVNLPAQPDLRRRLYVGLLRKLKDAARDWAIVGDNYLVCAPNSSEKFDIRRQLMQWNDRTRIDGSLIVSVLDKLWDKGRPVWKEGKLVRFDGQPLGMVSKLLTKFTGRCAYLEVECSPIERPRLCAEAFTDLVEWQTLLMLPGFCDSIIVPKHLTDAILAERDGRDFRVIKPVELFKRWGRSSETGFQGAKLDKLPRVIQMMWHLVTKVLPVKDARAVSLEDHVMQLTWKSTTGPGSRQYGHESQLDSHALELAHLSKRMFMLISCTALTVAGALVSDGITSGMHLLSPLLQCLKELRIPPVMGGVSDLLNKPIWTIKEMRDAVTKSARELHIALAHVTVDGIEHFTEWHHGSPPAFYKVLDQKVDIRKPKNITRMYPDPFKLPSASWLDVPEFQEPITRHLEKEKAVRTLQKAVRSFFDYKRRFRRARLFCKQGLKSCGLRARDSLWVKGKIDEIVREQERAQLKFTDPGGRLEWVYMGLDCNPVTRDICTVCPKQMVSESEPGHQNSEHHIDQEAAFHAYMEKQDYIADVLEEAYVFQHNVKKLQGNAEADPDDHVVLSDLRQQICTEHLEQQIQEAEEDREWIKLNDLLGLAEELRKILKKCRGELVRMGSGNVWTEPTHDELQNDIDDEMEEHDLCDFSVVEAKASSKKSKKKSNNKVKINRKQNGI